MAVSVSPKSVRVSIKCDTGNSTKSINLGTLNPEKYDDEKAMAIINLLDPLVMYSRNEVQRTNVYTIEDE